MSNGRDSKFKLKVAEDVAINAVFGVFFGAIEQRRTEGLTKAYLCEYLDKDKSQISKITSFPSNMKISTMSNLAEALDCNLEVALVDRKVAGRVYTLYGVVDVSNNTNTNVSGSVSGTDKFVSYIVTRSMGRADFLSGDGSSNQVALAPSDDRPLIQTMAHTNYAG